MCRKNDTEKLKLQKKKKQSEEAVKEWIQSVVVGGNSLIRSLEHSQVTDLVIHVIINIIFMLNQ